MAITTTKVYRGKLRDGSIEWIGDAPNEQGEVEVTLVRPDPQPPVGDKPFRIWPGMFGPPLPSTTTAEEDIRFIKSLAEPKELPDD
jgi:hypothetical protein